MNRKEAKILMPVIQAFADGKDVETKTSSGWISIENMSFAGNPDSYRIKPEPKYRPFKDAEECWNEMLKHQPFGWVKCESCYNTIVSVSNIDVVLVSCSGDSITQPFDEVMDDSTFADGTPFGVKVE